MPQNKACKTCLPVAEACFFEFHASTDFPGQISMNMLLVPVTTTFVPCIASFSPFCIFVNFFGSRSDFLKVLPVFLNNFVEFFSQAELKRFFFTGIDIVLIL